MSVQPVGYTPWCYSAKYFLHSETLFGVELFPLTFFDVLVVCC